MRKLLAVLIGLALATGHAAAAPAVMHARPALWVVKDDDTTVYLFGTVHLLKPEIAWFEGDVKRAYDASGEVVMEMVQPDPAAMQALVLKLAVDPSGPPLTTKLGPELAALYKTRATALGLPVAAFERFEPWFVATVMSVTAVQQAGLDPASGAERVLTAAAQRDAKPVTGLETAEQQLGYFDALPEPLQIAFLKDTLAQLPQTKPVFEAMLADWTEGDPDALSKLLNDSMTATPELEQILLTDRNARWADWIRARMAQPGVVFLAVGAGHLAGPNSVQTFLAALQIAARRMRD